MIVTIVAGVSALSFLAMVLREVFPRDRAVGFAIAGFVAVFATLAASGVFEASLRVFPPVPIRIMMALMLALAATLAIPRTRRLWDSIPTDRLVRWHVVRAPIGLAFVLAAAANELAPEFGHRAGWGDLLAGLWAAAWLLRPGLRKGWGTPLWNAIAFTDLLLAVGTAALTLDSPMQLYPHAEQMRLLTRLPLVLVPGFAVPVLFFSHFLVFKRGRPAPSGLPGAAPR